MTVEELANKRYSGEFVFMLGHLEGITRFVFECAAIEYSKGGEVVVVPGTWHGKFKKEWPTEEEKKHIGKNGILNY